MTILIFYLFSFCRQQKSISDDRTTWNVYLRIIVWALEGKFPYLTFIIKRCHFYGMVLITHQTFTQPFLKLMQKKCESLYLQYGDCIFFVALALKFAFIKHIPWYEHAMLLLTDKLILAFIFIYSFIAKDYICVFGGSLQFSTNYKRKCGSYREEYCK